VRKSKIRRPMATEEEARVTIRHGGHSGRSTHPLCKHHEWPSNAEYMQDFDNMSKKTVRIRDHTGVQRRKASEVAAEGACA
jgi:hypothetical protein